MSIEFLTVDDVLLIHRDQIARYGGDFAVRDYGLLESAVAMPHCVFEGNFLHRDPFEMAAAYLYHLAQNHPFVDGNKRTAAVAALVFLRWNNLELSVDPDGLFAITIEAAAGTADKPKIATYFRGLVQPT